MEKREGSYTVGGLQTSTATMENSVEVPANVDCFAGTKLFSVLHIGLLLPSF